MKSASIYALAMVVILMSFECCAAVEDIKMVTITNKDAIVRAECINASTGMTVGFRIEIMNPNQNKNLAILLRDDISRLFRVQLINEKGDDISAFLSPLPSDRWGPYPPLKNKHEIILSRSNCFWFIPVPNQVRADLRKFTNKDNLMPVRDGKYEAEIQVAISYFLQGKGESMPEFPNFPEYQILRLTLSRIPIVVDSKQLGQNLEDLYHKRLLRLEAAKRSSGNDEEMGSVPRMATNDIFSNQVPVPSN